MPEIGRIQSTNFQSLLTELGITRANVPFALRSEVTPVVLVGGTVSFEAAATPTYRVQDTFTIGPNTAPPAATVLADTGQLVAGIYGVDLLIDAQEANMFDFEWRNFDNTVILFRQRFMLESASGGHIQFFGRFDVVNDNERFRVLNITAAAVGQIYQCSILARR